MRVMIRKTGETFSAYVAKKDLEQTIVQAQTPTLWGGWVELANGWRLQLPDMAVNTRLPITVEARRLSATEARSPQSANFGLWRRGPLMHFRNARRGLVGTGPRRNLCSALWVVVSASLRAGSSS